MASVVKCVNTIRCLAADTVQKANSGHPGAPMGCAPMAHVLWTQFMNYNPANPVWSNRDRFVLSNGHGCALQYCMLHLTGYKVAMDDLKSFRQLGSLCPGHPENFVTDGIEVSTGPLGQGISNAVGLAISEAHLASIFNKPGFNVIDHYTYVICGDGCLQEGVSAEASSLAGHLGLGKLILLYDDNNITIDGETHLSFTENVLKRYEAYGWHIQYVVNGDSDFDSIAAAVTLAKSVTDKPSIIAVKTCIGKGSAKEGTEGVHGSPLGESDIVNVKTKFGFDPTKKFQVDDDVYSVYRGAGSKGAHTEKSWNELFSKYAVAHPDLAADFTRRFNGVLPAGWQDKLPVYKVGDKADATRNTSGKALNALADIMPEMIGGSADLTPSNKTQIKSPDFQKDSHIGRYLRFGVREHAMAAICNGIVAHGGLIPFCATFLNFVGYALGAIRLSALSGFRVIYIMTHDSIGLGEDGPTHQPIETLISLRGMPNMHVFRPCDGNEVSGSYAAAMLSSHTPSTFALSRQNLPILPGTSVANTLKGAYVIGDNVVSPKIILVGSGSEVELCFGAAKTLNSEGISTRVVSMPCMELFEQQSNEYKKSIFSEGAAIISVECASPHGWEKYSHYQIAMRTFGASAPIEALYPHFGFTVTNIVSKSKSLLEHYKGKSVPWLADVMNFDLPKALH